MAAGKFKAVALKIEDAEDDEDIYMAAAVRLDISKSPAEFVGKAWSLVFDNEAEALEYAELQLSL
ncbi:MAG: hypothetical protein ACREUW_00090 [Burkholderiales bacterium]